MWIEFKWLRIDPTEGRCEHENETSGPIKLGEFLDLMRNYQLLKKKSPQWNQCLRFEGFLDDPRLRGRKILNKASKIRKM